MDWMFIIGFTVSTMSAPMELPNPGIPEQNAPTIKSSYNEIGRRVDSRDRCVQLMKEWEPMRHIGGHPIVEKKCVKAPPSTPVKAGSFT